MKKMKNHNYRTPLGQEDGFSLIEVIVALAILTIGILSVNAMQTVATRGNMSASDLTIASTWAADQVEQIFSMDYDDPALDDDGDGDGIGQDSNDNGIDDDDEGIVRDGNLNFGLDDNTAATADGMAFSNDPDQRYTIYWNVAVDTPMRNIKTIQVIVTRDDRGVTKTVTLRSIKSEYM